MEGGEAGTREAEGARERQREREEVDPTRDRDRDLPSISHTQATTRTRFAETSFIAANTTDAYFADIVLTAIPDVIVVVVVVVVLICFIWPAVGTGTCTPSIKRVFFRSAPHMHVFSSLLALYTHAYQHQDKYKR
jgi:hypothetical protein